MFAFFIKSFSYHQNKVLWLAIFTAMVSCRPIKIKRFDYSSALQSYSAPSWAKDVCVKQVIPEVLERSSSNSLSLTPDLDQKSKLQIAKACVSLASGIKSSDKNNPSFNLSSTNTSNKFMSWVLEMLPSKEFLLNLGHKAHGVGIGLSVSALFAKAGLEAVVFEKDGAHQTGTGGKPAKEISYYASPGLYLGGKAATGNLNLIKALGCQTSNSYRGGFLTYSFAANAGFLGAGQSYSVGIDFKRFINEFRQAISKKEINPVRLAAEIPLFAVEYIKQFALSLVGQGAKEQNIQASAEIALLQAAVQSTPEQVQAEANLSIENTIKTINKSLIPLPEITNPPHQTTPVAPPKLDYKKNFDPLQHFAEEFQSLFRYKAPIRSALLSFLKIAKQDSSKFYNFINFLKIFEHNIRGCDSWAGGLVLATNPSIVEKALEATWYVKIASIDVEYLANLLSGEQFKRDLATAYSSSVIPPQGVNLLDSKKALKNKLNQQVIFIVDLMKWQESQSQEEKQSSFNNLLYQK